jgi:hypothetical protein
MNKFYSAFLSILIGFIFYILIYALFYYNIIRVPFLPDELSGRNLWPIFSICITLIFRKQFISISNRILSFIQTKKVKSINLKVFENDQHITGELNKTISQPSISNIDFNHSKVVKSNISNLKTKFRVIFSSKKLIAREIVILLFSISVSFIWYFAADNYKMKIDQELTGLRNSLDSSYVKYSEEIFNYLESNSNYWTREHTFQSFRNKFDTSNNFRIKIYDELSYYDSKFKNKHSFDEFVTLMQTSSFTYNGRNLNKQEAIDLINSIEIKSYKFPLGCSDAEIYFFPLVILFILRYLIYTIVWCYKILTN